MNQTCIYTEPLNGLGDPPATTSDYFQFSNVECIQTATTTTEVVGALPQAYFLYTGLLIGMLFFYFIVNFFKNR